jgi:hypothetical protein
MATTTNYSWTTPDNTAYVKDGASAIRTLGSSVDTTLFTALGGAYPGLRLIKKQTIGAAVASVSVTNVFSAAYENYKIVINGGVGSTTAYLDLKLTGSGNTYSWGIVYNGFNTTTTSDGGTGVFAARYQGAFNTSNIAMNNDICNPFLAKSTTFSGSLTQFLAGTCAGVDTNAASYTGITISTTSGTLTGGTIYVYGYGIS